MLKTVEGYGGLDIFPGSFTKVLIKDLFHFSKFHKICFPPSPLANLVSPAIPRMQISLLQPCRVGGFLLQPRVLPLGPRAFLGLLSCHLWSLGIQSVKWISPQLFCSACLSWLGIFYHRSPSITDARPGYWCCKSSRDGLPFLPLRAGGPLALHPCIYVSLALKEPVWVST